ncbi:MAG: glycogen/starch synthase [Chlamydiia bacterium]|nr:glycogen/starch synthase [Chlamydiia bacterium]
MEFTIQLDTLERKVNIYQELTSRSAGFISKTDPCIRNDLTQHITSLIEAAQLGKLAEPEMHRLIQLSQRATPILQLGRVEKAIATVFRWIERDTRYRETEERFSAISQWTRLYSEYSAIEEQLKHLLPSSQTGVEGRRPTLSDFFQLSFDTTELVLQRWRTATALASLEHFHHLLLDPSIGDAQRAHYFLSLPKELRLYITQCLSAAIRANHAYHSHSTDDLQDNPRALLKIINRDGDDLAAQMSKHLKRQLEEESALATLTILRDQYTFNKAIPSHVQGLLAHLPSQIRSHLLEQGILQGELPLKELDQLLQAARTACRGDLRSVFDPADTALRGFTRDYLSADTLNSPTLQTQLIDPLNVTFVAAECSHVLKQGGLAEAVFGLAHALTQQHPENKVRLIMPLYDGISDELKTQLQLRKEHTLFQSDGAAAEIWKTTINGVRFYFVERQDETFRTGGSSIYGPDDVVQGERFACFADAAACLLRELADKTDVIHLHDWHAAGVAPILKTRFADDWKEGRIPPVVFTFHNNNRAAQGVYDYPERLRSLQRYGVADGHSNLFVEALRIADGVTTVSETFALESQRPDLGASVQSEVNAAAAQGKLAGILNGSNPQLWNPETDAQLRDWIDPTTGAAIDLSYGPQCSIPAQRHVIRSQLQSFLSVHAPHVRIDLSKPLITYVGRYDAYQKGLDMFEPAIEAALANGAQFIAMGSQEDPRATEILDRLQRKYPNGVWIIRDKKGADGRYEWQHGTDQRPGIGSLVRAATDFTFVPSEFEPCGLVQFEGWLFGNLVIASQTGGLGDSVKESGPEFNGFLFPRRDRWLSDTQRQLVKDSVQRALDYYAHLDDHARAELSQRVMQDARAYSWNSSAYGLSPVEKYRLVYAAAKARAAKRDHLFLETLLGND